MERTKKIRLKNQEGKEIKTEYLLIGGKRNMKILRRSKILEIRFEKKTRKTSKFQKKRRKY